MTPNNRPPTLLMTLLAVRDLDRSRAFYDSAFGWEKTLDVPVIVKYDVPGGGEIALYARDGFSANTLIPPQLPDPGAISGTELYFHVEDLAATTARLEAAGATLLAPAADRAWGDRAAYYADPDGNVLAIGVPLD